MRKFWILAVVLALVVPLQAALYIDFEQLPVTNTAVGFTTGEITPNPAGGINAISASCRLETAEIRFVIDGTTATSAYGTLLEPGDTLSLSGHDILVNFSAIRTGATSGTLDCNYTNP